MASSRRSSEASSRYRIEVDLEIDGKEYMVMKVSMLNVDNSIPTIECYVVPEGAKKDKGKKYSTLASRASNTAQEPIAAGDVGYFLEQNETLSNMKGGLDKNVTFRMRVTPEDTDTISEATGTLSLELTDWVVVDAGIHSLSRMSPVTAAKIVIQHPMYKYNRLPLGLMVNYKPSKKKKLDQVDNILAGLFKGMKKYIDNHDPKYAKDKDGGGAAGHTLVKMDEERVAELRELYAGLNKVIVWEEESTGGNAVKKPGLPYSWIKEFLNYAKVIFAEPNIFYDNTMFHAIKRGLVPMFLGVTGEFGFNNTGKTSKPMVVVQRNPWEVPYCEVNVDSLSKMSLPTINTPLEAVVVQGASKYGSPFSTLTNYQDTASAMALQRSDASAGYFEHVDKLKGVVVYTKPPSWITGYLTDSGRRANKVRDPMTTKGQTKEDNAVDAKRANSEKYFEMLKRYAKDVFYDRFYRGSKSSWEFRFMPTATELNSGGGGFASFELKPGTVLSLVENTEKKGYTTLAGGSSRGQKKERMRMYVTHVIHEIDVNSGIAKTTVVGSHARGPSGATDPNTSKEIVKERKLAIYDKSEKVE